MAQFVEIKRLIEGGWKNRRIARALKCRRTLVAAIRGGEVTAEQLSRAKSGIDRVPPPWTVGVEWSDVKEDLKDGHEIKRIWEERSEDQTSYSNFFKHVRSRFPELFQTTVTLRHFNPGEHSEVDYAGDGIEWVDRRGEVHQARVFLGILCFSQLIYAFAAENEKKENWLLSNRKMVEFFGGSTKVTVCDQLKNGVIKSHLYDPDLNPDFVDQCRHYKMAVVPARVYKPRDKALVENAVRLVMRYFRFIYRHRTFRSIKEINRALRAVIDKINGKIHTRFQTSRRDRFERLEKQFLQPLPLEPYERSTWKKATHHADCTVTVEKNFYSAPHIYRGKELRVKLSATKVEIFYDLNRIALHARIVGKVGERVVNDSHLPENSRAYRENSPQRQLSQARFVSPDLYHLVDELFQENALGNLRRVQGLVRKAQGVVQAHGKEKAQPWIKASVDHMRRFNRVRVQLFVELIKSEMKKQVPSEDRAIVRRPGNPMVRGQGTHRSPEKPSVPKQIDLI